MQARSHQLLKCSLHDWTTLRSQVLFIFDSGLPAASTDGHYERHGEYSAWLIRRGSIQLVSDGEEVTVRPGQWLFCFGKTIHQKLSPDVQLLSLRMALSWPDGTLLFHSPQTICLLESAKYPQLEVAAKKLLADTGHIQWQRENPAYTFLWRTLLDHSSYLRHQQHLVEWTEMVSTLLQAKGWHLRIPGGMDPRLASALFFLDNRRIGASFPAEGELVHPSLTLGQLNRMCVKACGCTLYVYWERRKVEYAKYLLEQPTGSVKEIASELGFSQLSHFSAWFKRHAKASPRAYRNSQKKPDKTAARDVS